MIDKIFVGLSDKDKIRQIINVHKTLSKKINEITKEILSQSENIFSKLNIENDAKLIPEDKNNIIALSLDKNKFLAEFTIEKEIKSNKQGSVAGYYINVNFYQVKSAYFDNTKLDQKYEEIGNCYFDKLGNFYSKLDGSASFETIFDFFNIWFEKIIKKI